MAITTWTEQEQALRADMRRRAREGAAVLERASPCWDDAVDPVGLDMGSTTRCVVGQLERNGYPNIAGLWRAEYGRLYPPALGLDLSDEDKATDMGNSMLYGHLTDAWIYVISERRAAREGTG